MNNNTDKSKIENKDTSEVHTHFIDDIINKDLNNNKNQGRIITRFPPEPNGYLHIGHAKSICLNFGMAKKYSGICNLRFDDTNPESENTEYVKAIKDNVEWLGFKWDNLFFASDYFDKMYNFAIGLVKDKKAYVESLTAKEIKDYRGDFNTPGKNSPFRDRTVEENLKLFKQMKDGKFKDGEVSLRAKIDMQSPNMNMRDPVIYRIRHANHHRTENRWCIYPMYDWAHGIEDSIEGVTHSLCTLEFENHRPLYNWFLEQLCVHKPQQIEFARLNLTHTVMSKRALMQLVQENIVSGWDDPRMPTISGMRRLGIPASALRRFSDRVGVAKRENIVDYALLEHTVRDELNKTSHRLMGVLNPLKIIIENYPEDKEEFFDAPFHPIDDFAKLDLRVGKIILAEEVKNADKLLKILVDIGESEPRQVFAGIKKRFKTPKKLIGENVIVVANLKPRKMKFGISNGMILAASGKKNRLELANVKGDILPGDTIG